MTVAPQRLKDAVRAWKATPRPVENFLAGSGKALTYDVECDLEHQASYIETMVRALQEGNPHWDFAMRAEGELKDLTEFEERIDCLELPVEQSGPLRRYTEATRAVLKEVLAAAARRHTH